MILRRSNRGPRQKHLEQQTDFTAEGSPPPGKVATTVPATSDAPSLAPRRRLPAQPR